MVSVQISILNHQPIKLPSLGLTEGQQRQLLSYGQAQIPGIREAALRTF